ncbi:CHAT domain-containing protein [Nocardioides lijunqiniae]|uniref:CHAT domain-containing protein n=1 Tax=Nocardioides lijunqiniae TaxID=2760832 RepID=UPI001877E251
MLSAEELHARGVAAINAGRVAAARTPLETALRRSTSDALSGSIEASLAYVASESGRRDEAIRLLESALLRPGLSTAERGRIHGQQALLAMLTGQNAEAMSAFGAAIRMLSTSPLHLGRAHVNRGNLYLQQNDVSRAAQDFEAGLAHLESTAEPPEVAMARHNLGYTRFLAGDLAEALRDMDAARTVLAPLSAVAEATCDQDRAEVLIAAGLVDDGRAALAGAARAFGSRRLRRRQAEAELTLSRTLLLDDPAQALERARSALRHLDASATAWRARAAAVVLAAEVRLGRSPTALVDRGRDLVPLLEDHGLHWPAVETRIHLGRAHLLRRDPDGAAATLAGIRTGARAPLAVRLLERETRAELAAHRGRRADALAHLRAGLDDLHAWQSSFGSLDLQTMVTGHGVRLARTGLRLAVESQSSRTLFEWSERARMLASRVLPIRAPQDEQTRADLTELRSGPAPSREAELRRRVREQAWRLRGSGEVTEPVELDAVVGALPQATAVVAHVVTDTHLVALVITARGVARHVVGSRADLVGLLDGLAPDLDVAASYLPASLAGAVRHGLATRLSRLASLLLTPVLDDVGDRDVVLTPSALLAGVPWTMLPGLTGRPVAVARSVTSWLSRAGVTPLTTAGLVAGPRVERAVAEVEAASRQWPGSRVLTGEAATAAAVSDLAAGVDLLHVAAHGRHSADNPLFSGLELADGSWFGYDIDQLSSVPQVVLLSACEGGRSSVRHGEELIGMATAWLHAGARWVIASPAAVDDRVAHDTLLAVHAGLRAGLAPPVALAAVEHRADAAPVPFVCLT